MMNENEPDTSAWDEDEDETIVTSPEAYRYTAPRELPTSRPAGMPPRPRPRGVPGSADYYEEIEEPEQRSGRPRPTRQSREEVEARLRQRARGGNYAGREQDGGTRNAGESRRPVPRQVPRMEEEGDYPYQRLDPAHQPRPTRNFATPQARPTRDFSQETPRPTRDFARELPRSPRHFYAAAPGGRVPEEHSGDYAGDDDDDIEEIVIEEGPEHRRRHRHKKKRGSGIFSILLTGCLGGLITLLIIGGVLAYLVLRNAPRGSNPIGVGNSSYNQAPQQQMLTLGSATQVIVQDQAGNVQVSVDPNASTATLVSRKHVQASSQSDADAQYQKIKLSITTIDKGSDPACLAASCLLINASMPRSSNGLFGGSNGSSIDLNVTLPASFNSSDPTAPGTLTVSAEAGNIDISGFNGVINLSASAGNITVEHTLIYAGTCIQNLHGNITINQGSFFDLSTASQYTPCSNSISKDTTKPWFNIKTGVGNLDLTLTGNVDNLLLDANTNQGTITTDFSLNISNSGDSATYHGPMIYNTTPKASLYVATSTGNIILRKQ